MEKILFIEGTSNDSNGDLKKGFRKLFEKRLSGKMPRIIMGDDTVRTIRKFIHPAPGQIPFVLIDLDNHPSKRTSKLDELGKEGLTAESSKSLFFMVQEMEAWFLSQPDILDSYFKGKVSKINQRIIEISDPSDFLKEIVKKTPHRTYHKVRDGVKLLELLDIDQLEKDFDDVRLLISTLSSS